MDDEKNQPRWIQVLKELEKEIEKNKKSFDSNDNEKKT